MLALIYCIFRHFWRGDLEQEFSSSSANCFSTFSISLSLSSPIISLSELHFPTGTHHSLTSLWTFFFITFFSRDSSSRDSLSSLSLSSLSPLWLLDAALALLPTRAFLAVWKG